MEILNYLYSLSLWVIVPLGIVGALLFVLVGPQEVLNSTFHGDSIETRWVSPLLAVIGVSVAIFAVIRVLDVTILPLARSLTSPASVEDKTAVTSVTQFDIESVVVTDSTAVRSSTGKIYRFKERMYVRVNSAYVGEAQGQTWVCFNGDLLYTVNCQVPAAIEDAQ